MEIRSVDFKKAHTHTEVYVTLWCTVLATHPGEPTYLPTYPPRAMWHMYRASTEAFHVCLSVCLSAVLLHVVFGLPLFLFPSALQPWRADL